MKIIPATYHQIPSRRDYIVYTGTPEQAAAAYAKKFGREPETIYHVKMFPCGVANYCEVRE